MSLEHTEMAVLIKNGLVIDPANGIDQVPMDILLDKGTIVAVQGGSGGIQPPTGCSIFDAAGCIVCPGLIDLHVHCFHGDTSLGVDPDKYCLSRGVTTVIDAGSAGTRYTDIVIIPFIIPCCILISYKYALE